MPDPTDQPTPADRDDLDEAACRVCGCTENTPCPGGCLWVPDSMMGDLCSRCFDDPGGLWRAPTGHEPAMAATYLQEAAAHAADSGYCDTSVHIPVSAAQGLSAWLASIGGGHQPNVDDRGARGCTCGAAEHPCPESLAAYRIAVPLAVAALEDAADIEAVRAAEASDQPTIPWDEVQRSLGDAPLVPPASTTGPPIPAPVMDEAELATRAREQW